MQSLSQEHEAQCGAPYTHTLIDTWGQLNTANSPTAIFLGCSRKPAGSGSNQGPFSREAAYDCNLGVSDSGKTS